MLLQAGCLRNRKMEAFVSRYSGVTSATAPAFVNGEGTPLLLI